MLERVNGKTGEVVKYAQSGAITRYLCRYFGMVPKDLDEEFKAEQINSVVTDYHDDIQRALFMPWPEERKRRREELFNGKTTPDLLSTLQT